MQNAPMQSGFLFHSMFLSIDRVYVSTTFRYSRRLCYCCRTWAFAKSYHIKYQIMPNIVIYSFRPFAFDFTIIDWIWSQIRLNQFGRRVNFSMNSTRLFSTDMNAKHYELNISTMITIHWMKIKLSNFWIQNGWKRDCHFFLYASTGMLT